MSSVINSWKMLCAGIITVLCSIHTASGAAIFTNVVDSTMTKPDGPSTFPAITLAPSIDGPDIGFAPDGTAIYSTKIGGGTSLIAKAGTSAGASEVFSPVNGRIFQVSGNNIVMMGRTDVGGPGVFVGKLGITGVTTIANSLTPAPSDLTRRLGSFSGSPSISGNTVVFNTTGSTTTGSPGTYTATIGSPVITALADFTSTVPGQTVNFRSFNGSPAISGNHVTFVGTWGSGPTAGSGVYTGTAGVAGFNGIADTTTTAPGQSSLFTSILTATINGNNVAFIGYYNGGQGVYSGDFGTSGASRIVDTTFLVPGLSQNFVSFLHVCAGSSNTLFDAFWTGGSGIFITDGGSIFPIISTGDTLFGSNVTSLHLGQFGYDSVNDTVSFSYVLSNGTSGIAVADVSTIPEPSIIAWIGLIGLICRRHKCPTTPAEKSAI